MEPSGNSIECCRASCETVTCQCISPTKLASHTNKRPAPTYSVRCFLCRGSGNQSSMHSSASYSSTSSLALLSPVGALSDFSSSSSSGTSLQFNSAANGVTSSSVGSSKVSSGCLGGVAGSVRYTNGSSSVVRGSCSWIQGSFGRSESEPLLNRLAIPGAFMTSRGHTVGLSLEPVRFATCSWRGVSCTSDDKSSAPMLTGPQLTSCHSGGGRRSGFSDSS